MKRHHIEPLIYAAIGAAMAYGLGALYDRDPQELIGWIALAVASLALARRDTH